MYATVRVSLGVIEDAVVVPLDALTSQIDDKGVGKRGVYVIKGDRAHYTPVTVLGEHEAQAAVDGTAQIIVAHGLTNASNDQAQLAPLLDAIRANLGTNPDEVSADAGYCSDANLRTIIRRRIAGYIATGRQKHGTKSATSKKAAKPGSLIARMSAKLKRAGYRSHYRLRKQIVEPVFGQIKQARGFRQFLLRGLDKVKAEWALICTAHNLVKLATAA
ncbi:MAG: transposase [Gammaproteobacteria bacterium]|nr:transposase [Gammaproteobacteria bacterium]